MFPQRRNGSLLTKKFGKRCLLIDEWCDLTLNLHLEVLDNRLEIPFFIAHLVEAKLDSSYDSPMNIIKQLVYFLIDLVFIWHHFLFVVDLPSLIDTYLLLNQF